MDLEIDFILHSRLVCVDVLIELRILVILHGIELFVFRLFGTVLEC